MRKFAKSLSRECVALHCFHNRIYMSCTMFCVSVTVFVDIEIPDISCTLASRSLSFLNVKCGWDAFRMIFGNRILLYQVHRCFWWTSEHVGRKKGLGRGKALRGLLSMELSSGLICGFRKDSVLTRCIALGNFESSKVGAEADTCEEEVCSRYIDPALEANDTSRFIYHNITRYCDGKLSLISECTDWLGPWLPQWHVLNITQCGMAQEQPQQPCVGQHLHHTSAASASAPPTSRAQVRSSAVATRVLVSVRMAGTAPLRRCSGRS